MAEIPSIPELLRTMDWSRSPLGPIESWRGDLLSLGDKTADESFCALLWAAISAFDLERERAEALESLFDQAPVPILVLKGEDLLVTLLDEAVREPKAIRPPARGGLPGARGADDPP